MLFLRRSLAGMLCALALVSSVSAQELSGAWITDLPQGDVLRLGSRVIREGDVLTAAQLERLTLQGETEAVIRYLPIREGVPEPEAELVISLGTRKNDPPAAEDGFMETYRDLPNEGLLCVSDPEGEALTFTLKRQPRRGEVVLREDGSFLYTPKKNKVGTDSFTFTATDPAGNSSREATVTVRILKPSDEKQYADTAASDCRFEAEWLRSTGIFTGETVNGQFCFSPDESVSRGQFLAMLMQVLDMPVDRNAEQTGFVDESPQWLKPYLAAAMRSGIISGYPAGDGVEFRADQAVSADEASLMVSRALDFAVPTAAADDAALPLGLDPLTRAGAAKTLYQVSLLRRDSGLLGLFR